MCLINVDEKNIEKEHICCAISDKKGETSVSSKKSWLKERFKDGLVFKKLNERGKVFIEYIPSEKAWAPINGDNYMYINCFWVSGKFKGQGYGNELLSQCIEDAKEKRKGGLIVLSSNKKMPFLSDPKFLKHKGFKIADTAPPFYELLYLPFHEESVKPSFKTSVKKGEIKEKGMVLYYSNQCPHTDKYVPIIQGLAEARGEKITLIKFENYKEAQKAPAPFTTYSFFYDGKFLTNEIFGEKKFNKFLDEIQA